MLVADNKIVLMHYTLKNEAGEVLDTSEGEQPLAYLHGPWQHRTRPGKCADR